MKGGFVKVAAGVCIPLLMMFAATAQGEDVFWRIDPSVKSCSMNISPNLTQDQFHRYVKQVSLILSNKSSAAAPTLGKNHYGLNLDYSFTPVNQHDLAWINTFVHPDEDCPLGNTIQLPVLRAGYGISDTVDIGLLYSNSMVANYSLLGAEVKHAFVKGSETVPAISSRVSMMRLLGVADYSIDIISLDVLASKNWGKIIPYAGLRGSYTIGAETTDKVSLSSEYIFDMQPYLGFVYPYRNFRLAVEYDIAEVSTLDLNLGFQF